jgi:5-methyltetrahydrofolate--homocysteine methyltransferase
MREQELVDKIAFNVVQGRVVAEDEGFEEGLEGQPAVTELVSQALERKVDPKKIVLEALTGSMETVGKKFDEGEYLIPDMLASAECVGVAMDILGPHLAEAGVESKGRFVVATVADDLHDIGKNIVAIMLKGAGFEVIDLGNNVPTERIVSELEKTGAGFLGLSALLTTTMWEMANVIGALKTAGIRQQIKVFIGGAPTSEAFARKIEADVYCQDAFQAVEILRQMSA